MATPKKPQDKRVYDIRVQVRENDLWFVLAISGDATLLDLHLALLGGLEWAGSYTEAERHYRFDIGAQRFQDGKGSRTALRRMLSDGTEFEYGCTQAAIAADCVVVNEYQVPNRRHYPKVVEAHSSIRKQSATWKAQIAARREYREYERHERRAVVRAPMPRDPNSAYAHGFFSAIAAGPMLMPTKWLERFISTTHESTEELNTSAQRVMSIYNEIADRLSQQRERFAVETLQIARRDANGNTLVEWQQGFIDAMDLNPGEWTTLLSSFPRKDILSPLAAIHQFARDHRKREWLADRDLQENLGRSLGVMTVRLWEAYRKQPPVYVEVGHDADSAAQPRVSRNAPCPCGSGKRYKRCCGSSLRAI